MAKRSRSRRPAEAGPGPLAPPADAPLVNSPFRDLGKRLDLARKEAAGSAGGRTPPAATTARPVAPPVPAGGSPGRQSSGGERPSEAMTAESAEALFSAAVAGAQPIDGPTPRLPPRRQLRPRPPPAEERADAEVLAQLCDLVEGRGSFDVADTDEFIEGAQSGLDRRIVQRLRRGEFAVQAHLDLHGFTRPEAREAVDRFLTLQRTAGNRCVLIIHGRGLNSKDQIPVLKDRLRLWLSAGRLAKTVLAFATARPADGGAGAVYVLLRRPGRS